MVRNQRLGKREITANVTPQEPSDLRSHYQYHQCKTLDISCNGHSYWILEVTAAGLPTWPPQKTLLPLLLYLISSGFKDSSWSILLDGLRRKMGPLGIHGGQPNPAFHQGLNFICFSQCNVQKKRSLNLRRCAWGWEKWLALSKQCFREWKRQTYHGRSMCLVKDKASQKRTSRRSATVKVGEDKDPSTHRKKSDLLQDVPVLFFSLGVCCFLLLRHLHTLLDPYQVLAIFSLKILNIWTS